MYAIIASKAPPERRTNAISPTAIVPGQKAFSLFRRPSRRRSHPLIQAYPVSRNQDDTASQGDHRATFSAERAPHKAAGLLATSSDDAHALGHLPEPNHCEEDYQDLPTVSPRPVVQRSQYRLGFRWRDQIDDEGDLDNRKHRDDERDGGA